jgi:propanol-preferring alcohol dehydrogenase
VSTTFATDADAVSIRPFDTSSSVAASLAARGAG